MIGSDMLIVTERRELMMYLLDRLKNQKETLERFFGKLSYTDEESCSFMVQKN